MAVPIDMKGANVMSSERIQSFVQENSHVLKNLRVSERRGKLFAEFDGTVQGVRIILMADGITRAVFRSEVAEISCSGEDNYDPIVGVALAEKMVILKILEKRGWPRYKQAINDLKSTMDGIVEQWD